MLKFILINPSGLQRDILNAKVSDLTELYPFLRDHDVLGIGASRFAVLKNEEEVFKIAWRPIGLFHNHFEFRMFLYAKLIEVSHLLAPVIYWREDEPLIQTRCLPTKFQPHPSFKKTVEDLSKIGLMDTAVNLGILDGHIVCYDYSAPSSQLFKQVENHFKLNFGS